jgi:hypothetical protein
MHQRASLPAPLTGAVAVLLAAAVMLLAGATAAHAHAPASTQRPSAASAGHVAAVIPPRVFTPRLIPAALWRAPRVQRAVTRINGYWQRVKTYAKEHPDEILERCEDLSDLVDLALDAWEADDPRTCKPIIEPLCRSVAPRHDARWPAYGIVLAGRYAGRAIWLTCQGYSNGRLAYYTPTLRTAFYARYVWTYWYPQPVPNMAYCG